MTDDLLPDGPDGRDEPLDELALAELRARLRVTPAEDPAVRSAHLLAALDAFDDRTVHDPTPEVVPFAPRAARSDRVRRRRAMRRLAIAAGVLLIAGFGISVAVDRNGGDDSTAAVAADAAPSTTNESAAKSATSPMAAADAPADASAAPSPEGQFGTGSAPAALPDLGEFTDDAALSQAVRRAALVPSAGAERSAAAGSAQNDASSDATATTAAAPVMGALGPPCPIDPGTQTVARAVVAGRIVVVVATSPSTDGGPATVGYAVIDQVDCARRPL